MEFYRQGSLPVPSEDVGSILTILFIPMKIYDITKPNSVCNIMYLA